MKKIMMTMLFGLAVGCGMTPSTKYPDGNRSSAHETAKPEGPMEAKAELESPDEKVKGLVQFRHTERGLVATIETTGLRPFATHGLHVHQVGKCEGPKFESAGDHYNPTAAPHGSPAGNLRHAGDLGNVKADKEGKAFQEILVAPPGGGIDLDDMNGRAVIMHAKRDDLKSQPGGDSGDRMACGILR